MLSNRDAVDIAINGSKQFNQKAASSNQAVIFDPVLPAHQTVAKRLIKAAEWLRSQEPQNIYAALLRKTAEQVIRGMPAKAAMYMAAGGNDETAKQLYPIADTTVDYAPITRSFVSFGII